jgi:hypothetical protein
MHFALLTAAGAALLAAVGVIILLAQARRGLSPRRARVGRSIDVKP